MEFFPEQSDQADLRQDAGDHLRSELQREPDPVSMALLKLENDFSTYDKDDSGFLTADELESIEADENNDDHVRRVAGLLKRDISSVEEYSDDEWFDENDGITVNDLHALRLSDRSIPQPGVKNWFRDTFSGLDSTYGIGIVPVPDPLSWGETKVPTRVLHVYRGSAAEYAGLQSNDLITKINGEDITQKSHTEVEALLNGERGSLVDLEIKRGRGQQTITIARKKQISADTPRAPYDSHISGPSKATGKDADPSETCLPNREYSLLIREAAIKHYDPFSLGNISELIHKYDCVIATNEEAHKKAESEVKRLTGDNYASVKDKHEIEEEEVQAVQEVEEEEAESHVDVEEKDLGDGIAYIRLVDFKEEDDVDKMEDAIKKHKAAEAFIIDLRGNPGGLLSVSLDISSMFIKEGEIARTYKRESSNAANPVYVSEDYSLSDRYLLTTTTTLDGHTSVNSRRRQSYLMNGRPVVVLINNSSASASEIFAGATKDNDAATLVGKNTFGKGIGQETFSVNSQHSFKMTTFRFTSPDGTWPGDARSHKYGIKPDVDIYTGSWVTKGSDSDLQLKKGIEVLNKELGRVQ